MKPDLAHNMIGEESADIIFQQRVYDAVQGHDCPQPGEQLPAGEPAQENIYGALGGEYGKKNAAGNRRLWIGIGKPGIKRRDRGIYEEPDKYQIRSRACK